MVIEEQVYPAHGVPAGMTPTVRVGQPCGRLTVGKPVEGEENTRCPDPGGLVTLLFTALRKAGTCRVSRTTLRGRNAPVHVFGEISGVLTLSYTSLRPGACGESSKAPRLRVELTSEATWADLRPNGKSGNTCPTREKSEFASRRE